MFSLVDSVVSSSLSVWMWCVWVSGRGSGGLSLMYVRRFKYSCEGFFVDIDNKSIIR